jgi:shikimate kinase
VTEFIRREFHVDDPDKSTTIRQDVPATRPAMPGGNILYIIGLEGSGKSAVAAHLAQALGGTAHTLPLDGAGQALEAILAAAQNGNPVVVEVPHKLLTCEAFRQRLSESGRVLYLMAGVEAIAARQTKAPEEEARLRERLGRQRTAFEPLFMQSLHLLVMADGPLDQVLAEALERVRM